MATLEAFVEDQCPLGLPEILVIARIGKPFLECSGSLVLGSLRWVPTYPCVLFDLGTVYASLLFVAGSGLATMC